MGSPDTAELLIRPETGGDRVAVVDVITAAFDHARAGAPVPEAVLDEQLRSDPEWRPDLTLVAVAGGDVVGQLTASNGSIRSAGDAEGRRTVVAVGPVAVRPDHQRSGIGSALVRDVIARARGAGEQMMVLLGSPAFYGRFGFVPAATVRIEPPEPAWGEHFQVLPLSTDLQLPTGRFRYPAPFEGLSPDAQKATHRIPPGDR